MYEHASVCVCERRARGVLRVKRGTPPVSGSCYYYNRGAMTTPGKIAGRYRATVFGPPPPPSSVPIGGVHCARGSAQHCYARVLYAANAIIES